MKTDFFLIGSIMHIHHRKFNQYVKVNPTSLGGTLHHPATPLGSSPHGLHDHDLLHLCSALPHLLPDVRPWGHLGSLLVLKVEKPKNAWSHGPRGHN
jgi:hypothetical protein